MKQLFLELLSRSLFFGGIFDWDKIQAELNELNGEADRPDIWEYPEKAQTILKKREHLAHQIKQINDFEQKVQDCKELLTLAHDENDADTYQAIAQEILDLSGQARRLELEALLSGEADSNDCFLEINAGAGGTESLDWAYMLARMYIRWAERRRFKTEIIHEHPGEEAGIKSISIKIKGLNAYGWLKTESGVHRLVRISPFDSNARRHTSFASVWVYPVLDESIHVEIEEKDIRIDTYRASGAGGQHVNKTESAIRITHFPTGIVVQCQNDRSQHRNKAQAFSMLKARLYELELRNREDKANANSASKTDIGWGHQIRSYVLHPYQMVKDSRTNVEKTNAHNVLDGDIDDFLEGSLASKINVSE